MHCVPHCSRQTRECTCIPRTQACAPCGAPSRSPQEQEQARAAAAQDESQAHCDACIHELAITLISHLGGGGLRDEGSAPQVGRGLMRTEVNWLGTVFPSSEGAASDDKMRSGWGSSCHASLVAWQVLCTRGAATLVAIVLCTIHNHAWLPTIHNIAWLSHQVKADCKVNRRLCWLVASVQVVTVCEGLLKRLIAQHPGLHWSYACLHALLGE